LEGKNKGFEKVLEEILAVKTILDDFSKAIFNVFNDVKSTMANLQNSLNLTLQAIRALSDSLSSFQESMQQNIKSLEERISGKIESAAGGAPLQVASTESVTQRQVLPAAGEPLMVRSFGVRVSPAFSTVVEKLEGGRPAEEIGHALEDARDQLQSKYPMSPVFYEMTQLIKQLKSSGSAKLDVKSAEEIMKKLEEWSERLKK